MSEYGSAQQLAKAAGQVPSFNGSPSEDVTGWIQLFELSIVARNLNDDACNFFAFFKEV